MNPIELEQKILDLTESLQEAVGELSQGIADVVELLGDKGGQEVLARICAQLEKLADKNPSEAGAGVAAAIIQGLHGLTVAAPAVTVNVEAPTVHVAAPDIHVPSPVVNVAAAEVKFTPTIQVQVPEQAAPSITIEAAREWRTSFSYDLRGRITDAVMTRVA